MSPRGFFVTGTDTGVGKTLFSAALTRALVARGLRVAVMKPVASGSERTPEGLRNSDALTLMAAANVKAPYSAVNPYCFLAPISPHIAAQDGGIVVDLGLLRREFDSLAAAADCVVVEGAGGWLAPIGEATSMADIAVELALPAILVVGIRLGCLNHAQLTRESIATRGVTFTGWVANHIDPQLERATENVTTLSVRLGAPPLVRLPFMAVGRTSPDVSEAAARLHALCAAREA